MKSITLMLFLILLIYQGMAGQKLNIPDTWKNETDNIIINTFRTCKVYKSLRLIPSLDLFHKRYQSDSYSFSSSLFKFQDEGPGMQMHQGVEEYPGSSVYFAKRPSGMERSNEMFFIIKPDSALKYYLLVKKPVIHKLSR